MPDPVLRSNTSKNVVLLVGLQASGKSTFFRARFAATHEHVSKDLFRNNKNPNRKQTRPIEAALRAGKSVVVDNTNPTVEGRLPLIRLGREHGAKIVGYYFDSHLHRCLERNRQRTGKDRVPDVALYATVKKLQRPSYSKASTSYFACALAANPRSRFSRFPMKRVLVGEAGDRNLKGHTPS